MLFRSRLLENGSNLFWPFSSSRQVGLGWMHSGDAFPNFFFVWLSIILILWNLNRFSAHPVLGVWSYADRAGMRFETFFLAAFVLPMTLLYLLGRAFRRQGLNGRADEPRPVPARTESDMKLMQGEKDEDIES